MSEFHIAGFGEDYSQREIKIADTHAGTKAKITVPVDNKHMGPFWVTGDNATKMYNVDGRLTASVEERNIYRSNTLRGVLAGFFGIISLCSGSFWVTENWNVLTSGNPLGQLAQVIGNIVDGTQQNSQGSGPAKDLYTSTLNVDELKANAKAGCVSYEKFLNEEPRLTHAVYLNSVGEWIRWRPFQNSNVPIDPLTAAHECYPSDGQNNGYTTEASRWGMENFVEPPNGRPINERVQINLGRIFGGSRPKQVEQTPPPLDTLVAPQNTLPLADAAQGWACTGMTIGDTIARKVDMFQDPTTGRYYGIDKSGDRYEITSRFALEQCEAGKQSQQGINPLSLIGLGLGGVAAFNRQRNAGLKSDRAKGSMR